MKSALVRVFGFPATIIHGDTLMTDRWLWLRKRLKPVPAGSKRLIDVGCGSGAYTLGAALMGYRSLGLTWDTRENRVARERAKICKAALASYEVQDVRNLGEREDFQGKFDVALCLECIEHILNDARLMQDVALCLKPGGRLYLTTPNLHFRTITPLEDTKISTVEDGGHVRRGYAPDDLRRIALPAGFEVEEIGYCSGLLSQKVTRLLRILIIRLTLPIGWALTLPLRIAPPLCDNWVTKLTGWPGYSITLVARKR
jgi:2-polyprenyl-3-methyl-5-hydroxy-6-metoxy-1,4-benzoquinol methylase